jgi:hypothetical protein
MGKTAAECAAECMKIMTHYNGIRNEGDREAMQREFEAVFHEACAKPRRKISQPIHTGDVVMVFKTNGTPDTWALTSDLVTMWQKAFPGVDVKAECEKAGAWVESNPTKRKTAGGMAKFLYGWMARANDRGAIPRQKMPEVGQSWSGYQRAIRAGVKG